MSYPSHREVELPLLKLIADAGGEVRISNREIYQRVAAHFPQITPEELSARKQRSETVWENRVQWVRLRLAKKGELDDWRSIGRQGIWRITERGRQRLEQEWLAFEARSSLTEPPSASIPVDQKTHSLIQNQLQEIGETLGKFATTEYSESIYRYDVVWKEGDNFPRATHCFEVQHRGDVLGALAKLKHASDIWGGKLFIVITGERDRQKARQLLKPYFDGTFHEIAGSVTVLTPDDVAQIHATMTKHSDTIKLFVSR